jgi:hypothetical protein
MKWMLVIAVTIALAAGAAAQEGDMPPEMQQAMMKMMTPGEHHGHLAKLAGKYTFVGKSWMAPGAPPEEFTGTRDGEMILGGRFLRETTTSSFEGMPFEGIGFMAYDNGSEQYVSTWIDNMSTAVTTAMGSCSKDGWSLAGEHFNAMTGGMSKFRNVIRPVNDDSFVFEWHESGPDGKEYKMMEITYTRQK